MKKMTTRRILVLSSSCLLAVLSQVQAEEQAARSGFNFFDDFFGTHPESDDRVYENHIEAGIGYNSNDSARFGRRSGVTEEGAVVNGSFRVGERGAWDGDNLNYFEASGDNLGLRSRELKAERRAGSLQGLSELRRNPLFRFPRQNALPGGWLRQSQPACRLGI